MSLPDLNRSQTSAASARLSPLKALRGAGLVSLSVIALVSVNVTSSAASPSPSPSAVAPTSPPTSRPSGDVTSPTAAPSAPASSRPQAGPVSGSPGVATAAPFTPALAGLSTLPVPPGSDRNPPLINGALSGIGVQTSTGNFTSGIADIAISGRGPSPSLVRTYNSDDLYVGPLGIGWTHSYNARLHLADDGSGAIIVVGPQGRRDRYASVGGGMYSPPPGVTASLTNLPDTTWLLKFKDQTSWTFNGDGQLTTLTDRVGNRSLLSYNGSSQLTSVSDPAGRGALTFGYDPTSGRLTSVTDWLTPTARVVTYGYDGLGRLNSVTDRAGGVTQFSYDTSSRLVGIVDQDLNTSLTLTYDAQGRVASEKDAMGLATGHATTFVYVDNGDGTATTTVTYPAASFEPAWNPKVVDTSESHGWLTRRVNQPSSTESLTTQSFYDAAGNLGSLVDPRSNTTRFCYDVDYAGAGVPGSRANLTRVIAPQPPPLANPLLTLLKYDSNNNVIEAILPKGVTNGPTVTCSTNLTALINSVYKTVNTFDASGALLLSVARQFTDPDAGLKTATTKFEYGDSGNPGLITRVIPPRGNTGGTPDYTYASTLNYGASGPQAGMLQSVTDALGNQTTYAFDAVGRLTSMVDQNGNAPGAIPGDHRWTYQYDAEDRLWYTAAPPPASGGAVLWTETHWDLAGNRTVTIDANLQVTRYAYDSRNLLSYVQESPTVWTDPNANPSPLFETLYRYDDLGSLTRVTRAFGDSANERATDTAYDGLFRLRTETQYPQWPFPFGSLTTSYAYDGDNNLQSISDPLSKVTTYGYDTLNRLVSIGYTDGTPNVSYTYDANGNPTTMIDGTGTTTYSVDELGRLTAVTMAGPKTVGYRYDLDGNRSKIIYPDATAVTYTFDKAGRLSSLLDWASRAMSYTYNPDNTVNGISGVNATSASYRYDNARRITQVTQSQGDAVISQNRYTVDPVGNRTKVEDLRSQVGGSAPSAWGNNTSGQLGDGSWADQAAPVAIPGLGTVQSFAPGADHSIALMPDGTLRSWGDNTYGQLGDGTNILRPAPVTVSGVANVVQASSGELHALALLRDGTARAWGQNTYGQLGDGTLTDRNSAVVVSGLSNVTQVSGAGEHSLALKTDGTVWAWGYNGEGELGDGTTVNKSTPVQVKGVGGVGFLTGIVYIAGARFHSLAVKSDGTVYAWGSNYYGQLGDGTLTDSTTPLIVKGPDGVTPLGGVAIVAASAGTGIGGGNGYSMALKTDGTVWAWGDNFYGQLGDGTTTNRAFAVRVGGSSFGSITAIAAGFWHGMALKGDGTVWTWGSNDHVQLGHATTDSCGGPPPADVSCSKTPGQVAGLIKVFGIFTHGEHNLVTSTAYTTTNYTYDRLYRLTSDGVTAYTYDPVGNRVSTTAGGSTTAYSYDRADRITNVGAMNYTMNAAGNLTARGTDSFTFNQADRLVAASIGGVTATYTYDGDGNRRSKTVGGITTTYVFDEAGRLPALLDDGARKYVWGLGLAYGVDGAGAVTALHGDALQSVRALTDATGTLTQTYQRDPFGVLGTVDGQSTQPFDFTGELRDPETGFVYLRSRMYDPAVGRFISRDTFGGSATHPQTQNRYSYAGNNPVTFADPTGRASLADFFPTAAALAQAILAAGATQPIKLVTGGWTAPVGAGPVAAPCAPGMAGECPDDFDPSAGSGGAGGGKLPQDAKVNPEPPEPLPLTRPTSLSPTQNSFVQSRIRLLKANGASDFRVNQQQVDINGRRVGINRPDLQYTVDGERFYEEFETSSLENALAHEPRIMANDPLGQFEPFLIP